METTWTQSEVRETFPGCESLQDVIIAAEQRLSTKGEVVCEVYVNNMLLSESDEQRLSGARVEEIESIKICSRRTEELVAETVGSIISWIPQIKDTALTTADLFRGQDIPGAQRLFADTISACQWLTEAFSLLKSHLRPETDEKFSQEWETTVSGYGDTISHLMAAYEVGDYVLASDVMEYDLTEALDKWLEFIREKSAIIYQQKQK